MMSYRAKMAPVVPSRTARVIARILAFTAATNDIIAPFVFAAGIGAMIYIFLTGAFPK